MVNKQYLRNTDILPYFKFVQYSLWQENKLALHVSPLTNGLRLKKCQLVFFL